MTPREVIVRELERDICYPENGANEDAILAALDAAGYVIVPKKPTKEMLDRAMPHMDSWSSNLAWWDKMIGIHQ